MATTSMDLGRFGHGALLALAIGCVGCNEELGGGLEQGVQQRPGTAADGGVVFEDAGFPVSVLIPSGIVVQDAGRPDSYVVNNPPSSDAGKDDAGQSDGATDAGLPVAQPSDAGTPVADAGPAEPYPTTSNPTCTTKFFRDLDQDGFGDSAFAVLSCTKPSGYSLVGGDCYDKNERAFPGALGQFVAHRGDGSFDYDCDGQETLARSKFVSCPSTVGACAPGTLGCNDDGIQLSWGALSDGGWTDFRQVACTGADCPADTSKVPGCGQTGSWGVQMKWNLLSQKFACLQLDDLVERIQTCR